ncbi:MAG: hypothetical protein K9G11_00050 [Rickettsiaceae bacterium]|nr:hypothetical protein [Rickettsiaceae bacterium]
MKKSKPEYNQKQDDRQTVELTEQELKDAYKKFCKITTQLNGKVLITEKQAEEVYRKNYKTTTKDDQTVVNKELTQKENEIKENEEINEFIYNNSGENNKLTQEEWMEGVFKEMFQNIDFKSIPEEAMEKFLYEIRLKNINFNDTTPNFDKVSTTAVYNQYVENISNSDEDMDKMINKIFYQDDKYKVKSLGKYTLELNEDY